MSAPVQALLLAPTAAESRNDVRTQIPGGTKLRKASVSNGIATIDLTRTFVEGTDRASLIARLNQLVWTATAVPKVTGVRLRIDGNAARSMGQGLSVDRTMTRDNVDPPIAIKVSSGNPGYAIPTGSYAIYRKSIRDWSYPYAVWLPYASYFNGGIAFHEYLDVPAYAASHGCVRVPAQDAPLVYEFAAQNTPVEVLP